MPLLEKSFKGVNIGEEVDLQGSSCVAEVLGLMKRLPVSEMGCMPWLFHFNMMP
jgi:hypothetical protein